MSKGKGIRIVLLTGIASSVILAGCWNWLYAMLQPKRSKDSASSTQLPSSARESTEASSGCSGPIMSLLADCGNTDAADESYSAKQSEAPTVEGDFEHSLAAAMKPASGRTAARVEPDAVAMWQEATVATGPGAYGHPFGRQLSEGELRLCGNFMTGLGLINHVPEPIHRGFVSLGRWTMRSTRAIMPVVQAPTVSSTMISFPQGLTAAEERELRNCADRLYGHMEVGNKCCIFIRRGTLIASGRGAYHSVQVAGIPESRYCLSNCTLSSALRIVTQLRGRPELGSEVLRVTSKLVSLVADVARDCNMCVIEESGARAGLGLRRSQVDQASIKLGNNGGLLYTGNPKLIVETVSCLAAVLSKAMDSLHYSDLVYSTVLHKPRSDESQ